MDAQKNPVPGAAADNQHDQNEVNVDLSNGQAQAPVAPEQQTPEAPSPTAFQPDPSMQVTEADPTDPAAPTDPSAPVTTDPYAPSPITDMQGGAPAPAPEAGAVDELAQVATANAGVEAPTVVEAPAPQAPVDPSQQLVQPTQPPVSDGQAPAPVEGGADQGAPMPVDPNAVPPVAPTPAPHNDKKAIIILSVVAVVLLAAIVALYVL